MKNKLRIIFMGTPNFAVPSLKEISNQCDIINVYTQPPRSSGRGLKTKLSPIHILANKMNFLVKTPNDFSDLNVVNEIVKLNVDFIIVVAYGLLLPSSILKSPVTASITVLIGIKTSFPYMSFCIGCIGTES